VRVCVARRPSSQSTTCPLSTRPRARLTATTRLHCANAGSEALACNLQLATRSAKFQQPSCLDLELAAPGWSRAHHALGLRSCLPHSCATLPFASPRPTKSNLSRPCLQSRHRVERVASIACLKSKAIWWLVCQTRPNKPEAQIPTSQP
jgi:hypothetical protein